MICFKSQTKKKSDSSLKMIPMPSKQLAQTPTRPPIKLAPKEIVIQMRKNVRDRLRKITETLTPDGAC
jgi:hypothetical protein